MIDKFFAEIFLMMFIVPVFEGCKGMFVIGAVFYFQIHFDLSSSNISAIFLISTESY